MIFSFESSDVLSVKTLQDSSFDEGIGVIRSNSSQTGYINMVGGAMQQPQQAPPPPVANAFHYNGPTGQGQFTAQEIQDLLLDLRNIAEHDSCVSIAASIVPEKEIANPAGGTT